MDIKRLLKEVETDDGKILLGESKEYEKYGKKIEVKQVNFIHQWDKFAYYMGLFLGHYSAVSEAFKLPDRHDDLEQFRKNIRLVLGNTVHGKAALKALVGMVRTQKTPSIRWLKKMFSLDDWCELFIWVYIYNILGVKKNLSSALKVIGKLSA